MSDSLVSIIFHSFSKSSQTIQTLKGKNNKLNCKCFYIYTYTDSPAKKTYKYSVSIAVVPTKRATYQIVLTIIYLHCLKGKFRVRVGVDG